MKPIFRLKNLNFTYNEGKTNEYQALVNVSLEIFPEEFVILYGPSGCGKSTLLNVIAGLEVPAPGTAFVYDQDISEMTKREQVEYHRKTVGMVYQSYNLITSLSVLDNVVLPQIFLNRRKRKRDQVGAELLERFGIRKQADKLPSELSGGQQQRIGIARCIINNPDIILADEPVGNLDSVSAKNVLGIFKDLNEREKKTIVLVTHNPEYLSYGDRIFYLKDGIIIKEEINKNKNIEEKKEEEKTKAPTNELQNLMRTYQGLSPEQINILIMPYKAKMFTHHFITNRNAEETKIFEDLMQRYLMESVGQDDFLDILNRPYTEGGVGFDVRTARKISSRVEGIMQMSKFVYQERRQSKNEQGVHEIFPVEEKAVILTKYLLEVCFADYKTKPNEEEVKRLEKAVFERLSEKISKPEMYEIIDRPFKEEGVGLNAKTARSVSEEVELTLILGFGVSQNRKFLDKKREQMYSALDNKQQDATS
ncbi:hypothetical protein C0584_05155 [Candidatus Parcubacteria bacterium]|nr:MAG: hypothetical protein C0584_05155 [Candidatus Parcubacteria bacterium]